jgi:D-sedoheptulose 7-phosphate isomerase
MTISEKGIEEFLDSYLENISIVFFELYSHSNFLKIIEVLRNCWEANGTVHLAGNGGSAAMVSHFATDWTKGLFLNTGRSHKTRDLNSSIPLITASANDLGWGNGLATILEMNFNKEDVLLIVSSSGNSSNLLNLAKKAKEIGVTTISLSGCGASNLTKVTDLSLTTSCTDIQQIEDTHSVFGHLIYKIFSKI